MAEDKITLRLAMVSVPERPIAPTTYGSAVRASSSFNYPRFIKQACILALIVALSIGCYFAISHYFVESVQVVGISMTPTLKENNHYLLNRWAFHSRDPQAGDVVVINDPSDKGISVKRIIAVGGQSVLFKEGKVFINGKELNEPYLRPDTRTYTYAQAKEQFITCGKDQYFLMGDNRLRSIDSRAYGAVPKENILGLVIIK